MLTTENATTHRTTHGPGTYDAASRLCAAWQWLEAQRRSAPEGADVWDIRWQAGKSHAYLTDLLHTLRSGQYRLSPLQLYGQGDERKAVWGAQDALVLKWVALCIEGQLPLHPSCEHVRGHGGGKQSIEKLHTLLTGNADAPETTGDTASKKTAGYCWVCRTDIRGYYRNINKQTLLNQVQKYVQDPVLDELIRQYVYYTVEGGGTFHTPESGISRGCPLSPLMGALHLAEMDGHFSKQRNIHYARYMDDVIILAKSRWSLRKHTKRLMQWFGEFGFEAHPEKTQIGRIKKGFDWMGAWLTSDGVTDIAPRAKANHREKVRRLYERLARVPNWLRHRRRQQVHARVSACRKRWNIWANGFFATAILASLAPTVSHASYIRATGLPATVRSDALAGEIVGSGTIEATQDSMIPTVYALNTNAPQYLDKLGRYVWMPFGGTYQNKPYPRGNDCPMFAFVPTTYSVVSAANGFSKTYPVTPGEFGVNFGDTPMTNNSSNSGGWTVTAYGSWILTEDAASPSWACTGLPGYIEYLQAFRPITFTNGGLTPTGTAPFGSNVYPEVTEPNIKVVPSCLLSPNGAKTIDFTSPLQPTEIYNTADGKVIAPAPAPLDLSISCSGDMKGVQSLLKLDWTNPASMYGSNGLKIGVASEGDATSGILLSTTDAAVGDSGSCEPVPANHPDWCEYYEISPDKPLRLYPVIIRNTNTTDRVKSGLHTVTGTLTVVTQ